MIPMPGTCAHCHQRIWWRAGSWHNSHRYTDPIEHFPCRAGR